VAEFLVGHPRVRRLRYPGLASAPGREILARQALGAGAMIAFELDDPARVAPLLSGVEVFLFAESLGGTESLITFPARQTHADMDPERRERLGINDRLLRLSIGLEDADDLIEDMAKNL
jgi:cystathionine gamma-synthase/cystathionine beta-lyase